VNDLFGHLDHPSRTYAGIACINTSTVPLVIIGGKEKEAGLWLPGGWADGKDKVLAQVFFSI
jgi:hypothetical protein